MDDKSLFADFWIKEAKTTRKVLSRIPEGSDYRPDPKSRTAHEIAWQIVCEEKMLIDALENGKAEWNPPPLPATMKEVLDAYEEQSAGMAERWSESSSVENSAPGKSWRKPSARISGSEMTPLTSRRTTSGTSMIRAAPTPAVKPKRRAL